MSTEADALPLREVRYEHTLNLVPLLTQLQASLLVSTYQAGKVVVVGVSGGQLSLAYPNFERAMGVAVHPDRIAVGTQTHVWVLRHAPGLAGHLEPAGCHDACYLTRSACYTGPIQGHEMAWIGEELWIVNTLFSCLCTPHEQYTFVPRWRPPFVSTLAAEDRCHLNGLAVGGGQPRFVTALAETDTSQGWRPVKATAGCVIDLASGATVARGFAMPHSPRIHQGRLWLLDSGTGRLVLLDGATGKVETVAVLPGYTRGLAFHGGLAFVGLSRIRETSTFGGVPIAEKREQLRCGVAMVDLTAGRPVAYLEFKSGVEEIFDVQVLPGARCPLLAGPFAVAEGRPPIWVLPAPRSPS
jgi:uncharacterized protein (TIGR03032 family)